MNYTNNSVITRLAYTKLKDKTAHTNMFNSPELSHVNVRFVVYNAEMRRVLRLIVL